MISENKSGAKGLSLKESILTSDDKPKPFPIQFEHIPADLQDYPSWILWNWVRRDGRWNKIPISAKTRKMASTTNPETWSSFEEACKVLESTTTMAGIGFVFTTDDPFVGIDLDNSLDENGIPKDWAGEIIDNLRSYTEISPTGTGVKIFIKGKMPIWSKNRKNYQDGEIEIYQEKRYFTVTGKRLGIGTVATIEERQEELEKLCKLVFNNNLSDTAEEVQPTTTIEENKPSETTLKLFEKYQGLKPKLNEDDSLIDLIRKRRKEKFIKLFDQGNLGDHGGDHSKADHALLTILSDYTGIDPERLDRLFRKSKLFRAKWDSIRGDSTYGQNEIKKVLERKAKESKSRNREANPLEKPVQETTSNVAAGLMTTRLDTLKPRPIRWLVPGYIPLGKLTSFVGDGGRGKSTVTLQMAADISRGRPIFGLEYDTSEVVSGEVLLVSCEDDFEDTIVPRLIGLRADLSKIHSVDGVDLGSKKERFTLSNFQAMYEHLASNPAIRLVIIDPAGAYIGGRIDDHKDSDLRQLLGPLTEVAAIRNVAIVLVKHVNKSATTSAVYRATGSVAWINAVRASFMFHPHPDDEKIVCIASMKCNLSPPPKMLSYKFEKLLPQEAIELIQGQTFSHLEESDREKIAQQLSRISWINNLDNISADDLLSNRKKAGTEKKKPEECLEMILTFLKNHAFPESELWNEVRKNGFSFDTFKKAKKTLRDQGKLFSAKEGDVYWHGLQTRVNWVKRPEK